MLAKLKLACCTVARRAAERGPARPKATASRGKSSRKIGRLKQRNSCRTLTHAQHVTAQHSKSAPAKLGHVGASSSRVQHLSHSATLRARLNSPQFDTAVYCCEVPPPTALVLGVQSARPAAVQSEPTRARAGSSAFRPRPAKQQLESQRGQRDRPSVSHLIVCMPFASVGS